MMMMKMMMTTTTMTFIAERESSRRSSSDFVMSDFVRATIYIHTMEMRSKKILIDCEAFSKP